MCMLGIRTDRWEFGRGMPLLGGLSVADTEARRIAVMQDGAKRQGGHAAWVRRSHKAPKAAAGQ